MARSVPSDILLRMALVSKAHTTIVFVVLGLLFFKVLAGEPLTFSVNESRDKIVFNFGGRLLLVYAYATNQFKPYVQSLYSLNGVDVLRDAPPDHLHHHGLMYAIRVNGVNFWEETGEPGIEKSVEIRDIRKGSDERGRSTARFTQLIHWVESKHRWVPHSKPYALLVERRTIAVTVDETTGEVALRWHGVFEVGPAVERVKLTGSNYNGLGLRLPEPFDHTGRHINSEKTPYEPRQTGDVTSARWSAVSQPKDDRLPMVALFDRSSNSGETRFFTMLNAFAYLAVTQNLEKKPLEYDSGESFEIDYLLCVYSEPKLEGFLEDRYRQWEKE